MRPLNGNIHIIGKLNLLLAFIIFTSFTVNSSKEITVEEFSTSSSSIGSYSKVALPLLKRDFVGFKEALAKRESDGRYQVVNRIGYLGKYQFGKSTLKLLDIHVSKQEFLKNAALQEQAFLLLCQNNKFFLRREIRRYSGRWIRGVRITESGILAAAHLAGAPTVQDYLRSNGQIEFNDAFGTSIPDYLKKFAGYDTSFIKSIQAK